VGTTSLDLFRSGNAGGAGLDRVRISGQDPDVDTYADPTTGAIWVQANGKGASTLDAPDPTWTGKAWRLPSGSPYPDVLIVWNDDPGHWAWSPTIDMPLSDYLNALGAANALFVRV
jgi:hypothetical protein